MIVAMLPDGTRYHFATDDQYLAWHRHQAPAAPYSVAEIIPLPTTAAECPSVDTGGHPAAGRVGQHRRGSRHLPQ